MKAQFARRTILPQPHKWIVILAISVVFKASEIRCCLSRNASCYSDSACIGDRAGIKASPAVGAVCCRPAT